MATMVRQDLQHDLVKERHELHSRIIPLQRGRARATQRLGEQSVRLLQHYGCEGFPARDAGGGSQHRATHWAGWLVWMGRRDPGVDAEGAENVAAGEGDGLFGVGVVGVWFHAYIATLVVFGEMFELDFRERVEESFD